MHRVRTAAPCLELATMPWRGRTFTAGLRQGDRGWTVRIRLPEAVDRPPADALVPLSLWPAMRLGCDVRVGDPVSPRLLDALPRVQDLLIRWDEEVRARRTVRRPPLRRAEIHAPARATDPAADRGVAAFFSAGVDSFYTVVRHRDEIDALVFVDGLDAALHQRQRRAMLLEGVRRGAEALDLPLVEVATDLRTFSDPLITWQSYLGSALAAVALLLGNRFRRFYVPATISDDQRAIAIGSHPDLDPLWSTEDVDIVHDGCDAKRLDKIEVLAKKLDRRARASLRVCTFNAGGAYNCGHCEKCLRTLVGLRALGCESAFESLPPLELRRLVAGVAPRVGRVSRQAWEDTRARVAAADSDPDLRIALDRALRTQRAPLASTALRVVRELPRLGRRLHPALPSKHQRDRIAAFLDVDTGLEPEQADAAFVFGSASIQPAQIAAELYRRGIVDWIVLTGGANRETGTAEADRYAEYLERSTTMARVVIENRSTHTAENVALALPLLAERIPLERVRSLIVVAKWFHARRAISLLKARMPPGVRYFVASYEPHAAPRRQWYRTARGRKLVLGEYRRLTRPRGSAPQPRLERRDDAWV